MLGHRVTLVAGTDPPGWLGAAMPGVEPIVLGSDRVFTIGRVAALAKALRPDVVFCPGNHYTARAALVRIAFGRGAPPFVWKVSNALERTDRGRLAGVFFRWLAAPPSRDLRRHRGDERQRRRTGDPRGGDAAGDGDGDPRNPRSMPTRRATPPRRRTATSSASGDSERQKDWPLALTTFAALDDTDRHLHILGEGSERTRLVALAARLGIGDRVHFPGFVGDVRPWLAQADLLLLTSLFEGTPNVVREAVAAGTRVVTTMASSAIPELLGEGGGTAVADRDPAALAAAIRATLAAPRPVPVATAAAEDPLSSARTYAALFARLSGRA
ncbi:glycosyltransferase [Sphingomonas sp. MMS24-JH45]